MRGVERLPMLGLIAAACRHGARTPGRDRKGQDTGRARASGGPYGLNPIRAQRMQQGALRIHDGSLAVAARTVTLTRQAGGRMSATAFFQPGSAASSVRQR